MNYPKRKTIRLKGYNYSSSGVYFITICTYKKEKILSEITGTIYETPIGILTEYGKIAERYLLSMSNYYEDVKIDKFVIMPNHIHMMLRIGDNAKSGNNGPSGMTVPTGGIVGRFVGTFKRLTNKEAGRNLWQGRSYDHIIRSDRDYNKIYEYIETNVEKWQLDCFYKY